MSLTRGETAVQEWRSVLATVDMRDAFEATEQAYDPLHVVNFLLRGRTHGGSVLSMLEAARDNARRARTAITREVWEATNECFINIRSALARPLREADLPQVLGMIRQHSALVRGALHGTMLRNDIYNFARLGTFVERADNTARIIDVKYYLLLPSLSHVGSTLDTSQWDMLLRSLSAQRSYRWLNPNETKPIDIARFLIFDGRFPALGAVLRPEDQREFEMAGVRLCRGKAGPRLCRKDGGRSPEAHHRADIRERAARVSADIHAQYCGDREPDREGLPFHRIGACRKTIIHENPFPPHHHLSVRQAGALRLATHTHEAEGQRAPEGVLLVDGGAWRRVRGELR
jgi:hypothetical protein